jgi:DNA invertase Pin-like site-specific DNA recombinase
LAPRRRNASEAVSARATCSRIPANLKPGHSKLATCHRLASLALFAAERGLVVAGVYVENASGASLSRPELFRLIRDSKPADVLLLEQVDRLTRLTEGDWQRLLGELKSREIRVVSIDLPTSWMMAAPGADEFTKRMFAAVNGMLLEVLAATARKDYEDRRRRQAQGIVKAKDAGKFKGRAENVERNAGIAAMLRKGVSWNEIQAATGCSRATIAKVANRTRTAA